MKWLKGIVNFILDWFGYCAKKMLKLSTISFGSLIVSPYFALIIFEESESFAFKEIIDLIPFNVFLIFSTLFWKYLLKYFCFLSFIKVNNQFLYCLYSLWSCVLVFEILHFINFLNSLFYFCIMFWITLFSHGFWRNFLFFIEFFLLELVL